MKVQGGIWTGEATGQKQRVWKSTGTVLTSSNPITADSCEIAPFDETLLHSELQAVLPKATGL